MNCVHDPLSREHGRQFPSGILYAEGRNALPRTPASINTFHTSSIAVAQTSCDVTHHSGVFTACYASEGGLLLAVYHSFSHMFGVLRKSYPSSVAGRQRECVTGDDLFKHVLLTQTAERRGRDRDLNRRGLWNGLRRHQGHPSCTETSIRPRLQSLVGLLPQCGGCTASSGGKHYLLSPKELMELLHGSNNTLLRRASFTVVHGASYLML